MPVHEMLGTARRQTEVYATYPPRNSTVDGYVAEAAELIEQGFPRLQDSSRRDA